jgi:hypothetical protein
MSVSPWLPVSDDMEQMRVNLRDIIGRKNPLLLAVRTDG